MDYWRDEIRAKDRLGKFYGLIEMSVVRKLTTQRERRDERRKTKDFEEIRIIL